MAGRAIISVLDWPLIGSPQATHILAILFDLTCPTCWQMQQILRQAVAQRGRELAILTIPVPLDPACNSALRPTTTPHPYSCEYTRLALALWETNPSAYAQFTQWFSDGARIPPLAEVRSQASRLVGSIALTLALTDPALDRKLRQAIALYQAISIEDLPQLLLANTVLQGTLTSPEQLFKLLDGRLTSESPLQPT